MAFPGKLGGGGKKGPRAHLGSFKNKQVKLRPAPEKSATDATKTSGQAYPGEDGLQEDDEDEEMGEGHDEFGYRENLRKEAKPCEGMVISVTGCGESKAQLFEIAAEMGGVAKGDLEAETTHLIADRPGSAKYEGVLKYKRKYNIKIMTVGWLEAVRDAWTKAIPVDYNLLEAEYVMRPFHDLNISITNFARGPHKDEFREFLVANGAKFHTTLSATSTHLIVASPESPHSQNNPKKLIEGRRLKGLKIVWEGWAHEVVAQGGERTSRTELWRWKAGGMEPTAEELVEELPEEAVGEHETMQAVPVVEREREEDREERTVVLSRKTKARGAKQELLAVDNLIQGYSGSQPTRVRMEEEDNEDVPQGIEMTRERDVGMQMELVEDKDRLGAKGKSVIKALSNSRSTSFHATTPARPKKLGAAKMLSTTRDEGPTAADDSAFFEDSALVPKVVEEEEEEIPQIFAGQSFALVMMGEAGELVGTAVEQLGGTVSFDEGEDEADWVCVPHLVSPPQHLDSTDPRIVTACWIELCMFAREFIAPADRLLEKPLPYAIPVPGAEELNIAYSGFSSVEGVHISRFVEALGGKSSEVFNKTRSHLIHAAVDSGLEPTGPKVLRANEWGIPIVGSEWLREFGVSKAEARRERKGKGKAAAEVPKDITNAGTPDRKGRTSSSASRAGGVLAGCTVLVSRKGECDRVKLSDDVKAAGGEVVQSFSTSVTHLVYASQKVNETFAEFKSARKANIEIVHPRWVDESIPTGHRQNESDFPHTYDPKKGGQLAGLVISPPRAHPPRAASASLSKTYRALSRQPSRSQTMEEDPAFFGEPSTSEICVDLQEDDSPYSFLPPSCFDPLALENASPPAAIPSSSGEANAMQLPDSRQPSNAQAGGSRPDESEDFGDDLGGMGSFSLPEGSPAVVGASSPTSVLQDAPLDTSSDPADANAPEPLPAPLPAPLPTPHVLLRKQTSVLNGLLQADPTESVSARMARRGMARKKSAIEGSDSRNSSHESLVLPPAADVPRRVPGMGFEPTQYTQYEEDSMDVMYEDPAALKAREKILAALGGGALELTKGVEGGEGSKRGRSEVEEAPQAKKTRSSRSKR